MMNELENLKGSPHARRRKRRLGRGIGSGRGKTAGRGHKGLGSRSGGGMQPWHEGGQMPLQRRLPKRGFRNIFKTRYEIVNTDSFSRFEAGSTLDPDMLAEARLIRKGRLVKILKGSNPIESVYTVKAHAFSKAAQESIVSAGGNVEVIEK